MITRVLFLISCLLAWPMAAAALPQDTLASVVSVLPLWPGHKRGGTGDPMADAPEGSAVAIRPDGYLATAAHVVDRATDVKVRLADGRIIPAQTVGIDRATDIAVLKIEHDLPVLTPADPPALGEPVCAIGNQFGLDLSVTCGVVSAVARSGTGFNVIEDFIQTDATVNPGASGGALVDTEGRLVGMLSAIFTRSADADIGVNFAVSSRMLSRVVDDLIDHGKVVRGRPGLRVEPLDAATLEKWDGVRIVGVSPEGAAAGAGIQTGDILTGIDNRRIDSEADVLSAIHLRRPGDEIALEIIRDGDRLDLLMVMEP